MQNFQIQYLNGIRLPTANITKTKKLLKVITISILVMIVLQDLSFCLSQIIGGDAYISKLASGNQNKNSTRTLQSNETCSIYLSSQSKINPKKNSYPHLKNFLAREYSDKDVYLSNSTSQNIFTKAPFGLLSYTLHSLWHPHCAIEAIISIMDKSNTILEINQELRKFLKITSNDMVDLSNLILFSNNWEQMDTGRNIIISYKDFDTNNMGIRLLERTMLFKNLWSDLKLDFPMNSIYLRNLGMEIIEVPNNFSIEEFIHILSKHSTIIENIFRDNEIESGDEKGDNFNGILATGSNVTINSAQKLSKPDNIPENGFNNLEKTNSTDIITSNTRQLLPQIPPNDPSFNNQWAFIDSGESKWGIEIQSAWRYWTGEKLKNKFVIALIDSGIDYNHPDLKGNLWKNEEEDCTNGIDDDGNGYIDDCYGWNFINNNNNPMDDNGHGTASAGILAAQTNNSLGVAGMCMGCELMNLKALNQQIKGSVSGFVKSVDYALEKGVTLSSNSYGGRGNDFDALKDAVMRAQKQGMIFVAAAGNYKGNNDNDKNPVYPASYNIDNIVSVAAITRTGRLASFSSFGKNSVDIAAPGERIFSTFIESGYKYVDGTSFAVPFVTGAIALLWSSNPRLHYIEIISQLVQNQKPCPNLKGLTRTAGALDVSRLFRSTSTKQLDSVEIIPKCQEHNPCDANAICKDTRQGPKCNCKTGLQGDGYKCLDINECDFSPCGSVSTCINKIGTFECLCNSGFQRIDDACQDIDECKDKTSCPAESTCYNFAGTYDCICPSGHYWSNKNKENTCIPFKSDATDPCFRNGDCGINSVCQSERYWWVSSHTCECLPGYFRDPETSICIRNGIMDFQKNDYIRFHPTNHISSTIKSTEPESLSLGFCIFGICF